MSKLTIEVSDATAAKLIDVFISRQRVPKQSRTFKHPKRQNRALTRSDSLESGDVWVDEARVKALFDSLRITKGTEGTERIKGENSSLNDCYSHVGSVPPVPLECLTAFWRGFVYMFNFAVRLFNQGVPREEIVRLGIAHLIKTFSDPLILSIVYEAELDVEQTLLFFRKVTEEYNSCLPNSLGEDSAPPSLLRAILDVYVHCVNLFMKMHIQGATLEEISKKVTQEIISIVTNYKDRKDVWNVKWDVETYVTFFERILTCSCVVGKSQSAGETDVSEGKKESSPPEVPPQTQETSLSENESPSTQQESSETKEAFLDKVGCGCSKCVSRREAKRTGRAEEPYISDQEAAELKMILALTGADNQTIQKYDQLINITRNDSPTVEDLIQMTELMRGEMIDDETADERLGELKKLQERIKNQSAVIERLEHIKMKQSKFGSFDREELLDVLKVAKELGAVSDDQATQIVSQMNDYEERKDRTGLYEGEVSLKLPRKDAKEGDVLEEVDIKGMDSDAIMALMIDRGFDEEKATKYTKIVELSQKASRDSEALVELVELARGEFMDDETADKALKKAEALKMLMTMSEEEAEKMIKDPEALERLKKTMADF